MHRFLKHSLAAASLAAASLAAIALSGQALAQDQSQSPDQGQAQAQPQDEETVKATHGDWEIVCAASKPELCVMRQIGLNAEGKRVLEVRIRKLTDAKTKDGKPVPAAIQITTPLGSLLRAGVRVQIDSSEPTTGAFEVCLPSGCVVRDAMSEEFLGRLRAGTKATMTFGLLQRGEIAANISLTGFTKAFTAL